jgi:two-component system LytT family response regulator
VEPFAIRELIMTTPPIRRLNAWRSRHVAPSFESAQTLEPESPPAAGSETGMPERARRDSGVSVVRALIVDDDPHSRSHLADMLATAPDVTIVAEAASGDEAVERVAELGPDLMILDTNMPGLDGLAVIDVLGPTETPPTIFCVENDPGLEETFASHRIPFVRKPVRVEELSRAMDRARSLAAAPRRERTHQAETIIRATQNRAHAIPRILVHDARHAYLIPVERIDRIEAARNYCIVHTEGRTFRLRRGISTLSSRLDSRQFVRLGRSDVVRIDAVREIKPRSHGDYTVILHDGTKLIWSRRYRAKNSKWPGMP